MMTQGNTVSVLLIDGENVPAKFAAQLAGLVVDAGREIIASVYGDFSSPTMSEWRDRAAKFGFRLHQTSGKPGGRNSADMLLALDAMDILFTTDHLHFCIASGDGDFTALAIRLRLARREVTGVGMKNASPAFRAACTRFVTVENEAGKAVSAAPVASAKPVAAIVKPKVKDIAVFYDEAIKGGLARDDEGWVLGSPLGSAIRKAHPGIKWSDFGGATLKKAFAARSDFMVSQESGTFKVRRRKDVPQPSLKVVQA